MTPRRAQRHSPRRSRRSYRRWSGASESEQIGSEAGVRVEKTRYAYMPDVNSVSAITRPGILR
jgi:hypothetical protein